MIGTSGIAAIAVRDPAAIVLVDASTGAVRRTVPTDGAARHLSLAGPDGPVLVPLETSDELAELNLADGSVVSTTTDVGRQPHDAVRTADGTIVVTNERGGGVVFVRDGTVVASLPAGPPQPGGIAVVGKYAAVADVQGNGVWVYDGSSRREVARKLLGTKLTHAVGLSDDLAAFADTDGGAVLIRARRSGYHRCRQYRGARQTVRTRLRRRTPPALCHADCHQSAAGGRSGRPCRSADHRCRSDRAAAQFRCRGSAFGGGVGHWEQSGRDLADRHAGSSAEGLRLRATSGSAWRGRAGRSDGWPQARARRPLPARPRSRCRRRPNETTDRPFATTPA